MLRRQTCATGLSESVTLLKSTFKPQAISERYYILAMEGKMFDVWLIPEFSGVATDVPIVEWVKNVELVCELCAMKNVELLLPLRLRGGALAIYRQLSAGQKADAEQIKQALIIAYATDHLMYMTSSSLDNLAQVRRWTNFLLSCDDWPGWLGDHCPNVG